MKIIISPAKKMNIDTDTLEVRQLPRFLDETKRLCAQIQKLDYTQAKALWKCNDKLARLNFQRFAKMDLERNLTPAILSYEGLQYQYMAPGVLTQEALDYLQRHLCILSGFYGVLSPFDGVVPYRLEMQAKLSVNEKKNLYEFWGSRLYDAVRDGDRIILNLASKEYAQTVEKYLTPEDRFITIEFGEVVGEKVVQKGTLAKMARGEMVRFLAENQIESVEEIKHFMVGGYQYCEKYSDEKKIVFAKKSLPII
ncbi:MAG: peroxide stress protein YaaA [Marvinbryantia sp.]|jgi:cytoplasmic iron level regulating protein YaaA (DUF328/UPF0246 family)